MTDLVARHKTEISEMCRRFSVRRLDVFGSALRDDFDRTRSDVDFLVEFSEHNQPGILNRYLALANELERLLQRPVDLVTVESIRNPHFRKAVESARERVYAA